jgi:hypothetical protein
MFHELDPDTRQRERFLLENSVRGYVGYLQERAKG